MLGRARLDHNQENPTQRSNLLPSKTPLRQQAAAGPSKPGLTAGKGLGGTAKGGRVLGDKDGNKGKTGELSSRSVVGEEAGCNCDGAFSGRDLHSS